MTDSWHVVFTDWNQCSLSLKVTVSQMPHAGYSALVALSFFMKQYYITPKVEKCSQPPHLSILNAEQGLTTSGHLLKAGTGCFVAVCPAPAQRLAGRGVSLQLS